MQPKRITEQPESRSNKVVSVLTERWRVVDDGELQWILQRRRRPINVAQAASEPSGKVWSGESFCTTSASLIRCIHKRVFITEIDLIEIPGQEAKLVQKRRFPPGDYNPEAMAFIEALPEKRREVVVRVYVEGLTYPEAAERTGIPLGSLKRYLRDGLAQLRDELSEVSQNV